MSRNREPAAGKMHPVSIDRRAVLLGSAAATQVPLIAALAMDSPERDATPDPRQPRYRETEHIRTFYARSRF